MKTDGSHIKVHFRLNPQSAHWLVGEPVVEFELYWQLEYHHALFLDDQYSLAHVQIHLLSDDLD